MVHNHIPYQDEIIKNHKPHNIKPYVVGGVLGSALTLGAIAVSLKLMFPHGIFYRR